MGSTSTPTFTNFTTTNDNGDHDYSARESTWKAKKKKLLCINMNMFNDNRKRY